MDESSKKNPPRIPPRGISLLVTIKQNLMDDNDLSLQVAECGKYAAAKYIDDLIANALELERRFHEIEEQYLYTKRENAEYAELLCGYSADILTDKEKQEIIRTLSGVIFKEGQKQAGQDYISLPRTKVDI